MEFIWLAYRKQGQGCLWVWGGLVVVGFFCVQHLTYPMEPFFFLLYWRKDERFPTVNLDPFLSIYYKAQLKKICMIFIILDFFLQN